MHSPVPVSICNQETLLLKMTVSSAMTSQITARGRTKTPNGVLAVQSTSKAMSKAHPNSIRETLKLKSKTLALLEEAVIQYAAGRAMARLKLTKAEWQALYEAFGRWLEGKKVELKARAKDKAEEGAMVGGALIFLVLVHLPGSGYLKLYLDKRWAQGSC